MRVHIVTYCKWMNFGFCWTVVGMKISDLVLLIALKSKFFGVLDVELFSRTFLAILYYKYKCILLCEFLNVVFTISVVACVVNCKLRFNFCDTLSSLLCQMPQIHFAPEKLHIKFSSLLKAGGIGYCCHFQSNFICLKCVIVEIRCICGGTIC